MPEHHASLDAALARNSGPSAEDEEALRSALTWIEATLPVDNLGHVTSCSAFGDNCGCATLARRLAAHTAAAEARGAERGARAVVEAVEGLPPYRKVGSGYKWALDAACGAAARVEGGA